MNKSPVLILYVEDDPAHAEIAFRSLEKFKEINKIVHVTDGQLALDYLYRQGEYANQLKCPRPDLILLDLRLPKVDGIEVMRKVRTDEELRSIPIVILTTSVAERDIARAYMNNVNSYLVKPLEENKFTELFESLGYYWLVWNTYPN